MTSRTVTINSVTGKFADIKVGMFVMGTTERDAHDAGQHHATNHPAPGGAGRSK